MQVDRHRRRFLEPVLGTVVLLLLPACGGGGGDSPAESAGTTPPVTPAATCGSSYDFNHGHRLTVARADLDSATTLTYDILGVADHSHSVSLTPAQLATLKTGASVVVTSSTAFEHQHVITVSCV